MQSGSQQHNQLAAQNVAPTFGQQLAQGGQPLAQSTQIQRESSFQTGRTFTQGGSPPPQQYISGGIRQSLHPGQAVGPVIIDGQFGQRQSQFQVHGQNLIQGQRQSQFQTGQFVHGGAIQGSIVPGGVMQGSIVPGGAIQGSIVPGGAIQGQRQSQFQTGFGGQYYDQSINQVQVNGQFAGQGQRVISERQLGSIVVDSITGAPQVVDVRHGPSIEVDRRTYQNPDVRVHTNALPVRTQRSSVQAQAVVKTVDSVSQKAIISERVVEKPIDVLIERPVPVYREVPKPVDVFVERPIEKIIERDVITEIIREKPIDKVIQIPIDKVIEIPIERVIEQPVFVDRYVDVPVQRVIDRPVERVVENHIFVDRVIEVDEKDINKYQAHQILPTEVKVYEQEVVKDVHRSVQRVNERPVEIPVEKIVQMPVPRMVDVPIERIVEKPYVVENFIEKIVEVPVERKVYNKIQQIVEEPEYITNVIQRPIPVERVIEVPYDEVIEEVVERPVYVDKVIERQVEHIIDRPIERVNEVRVEVKQVVEKPIYKTNVIKREIPKIVQQEVIYEQEVLVPVTNIIEEIVEVPIDRIVERPVVKEVVKYIENLVEQEVEEDNVIENVIYNEIIRKVQVEKIVEQPVIKHNIIEKPLYIEKIVEKEVIVPVEKIVEVPVDKIVEVPIEVIIENPVVVQREVIREVHYDKTVMGGSSRITQVPEDAGLRAAYEMSTQSVNSMKMELAKLKAEFESLSKRRVDTKLTANIDYTEQNRVLRTKINELQSSINQARQGNISKRSIFGDNTNSTAISRGHSTVSHSAYATNSYTASIEPVHTTTQITYAHQTNSAAKEVKLQ